MGVVNRSGVRFLFDSSMFEANFLADLLQKAHQLSIRIGICEVVITSVSGSLVIVDAVRVCVCKSSFLILTNCGRRNNKITNKQNAVRF